MPQKTGIFITTDARTSTCTGIRYTTYLTVMLNKWELFNTEMNFKTRIQGNSLSEYYYLVVIQFYFTHSFLKFICEKTSLVCSFVAFKAVTVQIVGFWDVTP
jgi:hypothetical protein